MAVLVVGVGERGETVLSSPSKCCNAEEVWGEPYISEKSGLLWQPLRCSKCNKEVFKTLIYVFDRIKFEEFLALDAGALDSR